MTVRFQIAKHDLPAFLACLAIGTLDAIRRGVLPAEAGIWTLGAPKIWRQLESTSPVIQEISDVLQTCDELSAIKKLRPDSFDAEVAKLIERLQVVLASIQEPVWQIESAPESAYAPVQLYELLGRPGPLWLPEANLTGANLSYAPLRAANLRGANLTVASLVGADLTYADLTGADLTRANLFEANLSRALVRARLREADLQRANLADANLRSADLEGANLSGANLSYACLSGANLRGANLFRAELDGADMRDADLLDANLDQANWADADLRGATLPDRTQ